MYIHIYMYIYIYSYMCVVYKYAVYIASTLKAKIRHVLLADLEVIVLLLMMFSLLSK